MALTHAKKKERKQKSNCEVQMWRSAAKLKCFREFRGFLALEVK